MAVLSRLIIGQPLSRLPRAMSKLARKHAKVMVIADSAVCGRYGKRLVSGLKKEGFDASMAVVPSGERSKTLAQAGKLCQLLARKKFERKSWLIALGGGVVGDMTGFIAATYLRGISFVQVPTTLLAQVDASIGGKTGVDIPEGKNLVGAFYHPQIIWIDPTLLKSLPPRHWRNGLAEIIKCGAIRDAKLFALLERKMDKLLKGYSSDWLPVIKRCAEIKTEVVAKDPNETKGLRAILNFGHSVGHAVEAAGGYRDYLHGEAISIGMLVAGALSEELSGLSALDRIRLSTLLSRAGLPTRVKRKIARKKLLQFLSRDKKSQDGSVRFVLLEKLGQAVSGQAVSLNILDSALKPFGL